MGFVEAVRSGFSHYADFSGRASRSAYWWWFLFTLLAQLAALALGAAVGGEDGSGILFWVVILALALPGASVIVRRLHDTGRSGWLFWISGIPIVGFLVLLVFMMIPGTPGPNKYGNPSMGWHPTLLE